jgi:CHASE3 domain sensor protein
LRADLAAQELANQKSLAEQEYLRPLLYNRQVEAQILVKRRKALEARLKELETVPVVRRP